MTNTEELKPCPFCQAALCEPEPGSGYFSHPGGQGCILDGFDMDVDGAPELAAQWNRRVPNAELEQAKANVQPVNTSAESVQELPIREQVSPPAGEMPALDHIKIGRLIAAATGKRINLRDSEIAEFYSLASMVQAYMQDGYDRQYAAQQAKGDAERLDFLDGNLKWRMGWDVGMAPVGNVTVRSIGNSSTSIREAIDAARALSQTKDKP